MVKRGYANADNSDEDGYRSTKLRKLDPIAQAGRTTQNQTKIHLQFLPDELLLRILSFLTVEDLMKTHRVSKRMLILAKDSQLWKRLYYGRFVYRRFGRQIKNSSSRQGSKERSRLHKGLDSRTVMDWKSKYRLSHKWSNGTCSYREIMLASKVLPQIFLCLRGNMAITVDAECGLRAWKLRDDTQTFVASLDLVVGGNSHDIRPSALSVEVSQPASDKLNIIVGFREGRIGLYLFDLVKQDFERRHVFSCFNDQAVSSLAQSNQGYLLAMSKTKAMSLFRIIWTEMGESISPPKLVFSLRSQSAWRPVSVSLRVHSNILIASILYAYPQLLLGWSVGIQELQWNLETHELLPSRHATSSQEISSNIKFGPKVEYLPPTSSKPTSLCYNHPYLLATHPDNTLSLYMVKSTKLELSISPGMRLWGHTSDVYAANIGSRGKAVTVAYGDDVRVWQLEEGLTSALARKATPGPLISVKLQPKSAKEEEDAMIRQDVLLRLKDGDKHEDSTLPASIDFDEERLVVLKNRGPQSQALFIYDFT